MYCMPRLSTSLAPNTRYYPYYPPITAQSVFSPEQLSSNEITTHRTFCREDDPKQVKVPKPRAVTSILSPEMPVVQYRLDFILPKDIEIISRPIGEAGHDFNLENTLDWKDWEAFNVSSKFSHRTELIKIQKELEDLANQHLNTGLPLTSQDLICVKQVQTAVSVK